MINFIVWIIFGALAGWLASIIVRRNDEQGAIGNIIVGLLGAVIGGYVARALGGSGVTGFNLGSLLVAVGGAVVLLLIYNAVRGRA